MRFSSIAISLLCSSLPLEVLALSISHKHVARSGDGPVITTNFQDPSLIVVDGTWYSFAGANDNPNSIKVQMASSPDFSSWTLQEGYDALPVLGNWHEPHAGYFWSPDVNQLADGTFVMYYSADTRYKGHIRQHCVGAATSPTIMGPYTLLNETLACNLAAGGAIDPDEFVDLADPKQARYVAYKVDGNSIGHGGACNKYKKPIVPTPIMIEKVASDGYTKIGEPVELISNIPSDGANIVAPALSTTRPINCPYKRADKSFLASGDTKAVVRAPGGIDFNANGKNYTRFVFQADLNLEWFHNKGKRDRGMFAASMEVDDDGVATVKELF